MSDSGGLRRTYLDWNAGAPLRPEAKAAMVAALDLAGNPSSVHLEGRASRALIDRAREDLAMVLGARDAVVIFTSGATEAVAIACHSRRLAGSPIEHDAVAAWLDLSLQVGQDGLVQVENPANAALQLANSETGIIQEIPAGLALCDLTQAFGKVPVDFDRLGCDMAVLSAHKIGGPRGVGALVVRRGVNIEPLTRGGGQEKGLRAGTENPAGIAGFAAAARAAANGVRQGVWERVDKLRATLEKAATNVSDLAFVVGGGVRRLPNTSCLVTPGWRGEVQVVQLDLAGFAVSSGAACSSGRVRASRVLTAMGLGEDAARSAIRVSLGLGTTGEDVDRFVDVWTTLARRRQGRGAGTLAGKARRSLAATVATENIAAKITGVEHVCT